MLVEVIIKEGATTKSWRFSIRKDPGVLRTIRTPQTLDAYREIYNVTCLAAAEGIPANLSHSLSVRPDVVSPLTLTAMAAANFEMMLGRPEVKEIIRAVTDRPKVGAMIRVTADPVLDEWTGSMIGEVRKLDADSYVLDAGEAGCWDVDYRNTWEALE